MAKPRWAPDARQQSRRHRFAPDSGASIGDAGILYVPDFIANCGGIVHVAAEFEGLDERLLAPQLEACVARAGELLADARARNERPLDVAVEHALERIEAVRRQ